MVLKSIYLKLLYKCNLRVYRCIYAGILNWDCLLRIYLLANTCCQSFEQTRVFLTYIWGNIIPLHFNAYLLVLKPASYCAWLKFTNFGLLNFQPQTMVATTVPTKLYQRVLAHKFLALGTGDFKLSAGLKPCLPM